MPLKIHFLNVGHGDCTFIELPSGRLMMIDINNSKSLPEEDQLALAARSDMSLWEFKSVRASGMSWAQYYESLLVDPMDYYDANFSGQVIWRYVQTHPDMDHLSGLHRFFWQGKVPLNNFWDTGNAKELDSDDFTHSPHSELDWKTYQALRRGLGPDNDTHTVLNLVRDDEGSYWSDDNVTILSPTAELAEQCNRDGRYNNISYVIRIDYGGRRIILPGDAEASAWESILDDCGENALSCDLLKASHHGRESGFHQEAAEAMDPSLVVCSVGKKPSTDASDEYAALGATVMSTRFHGTMVATMWGDGEVWVDDRKGDRIASLPILRS